MPAANPHAYPLSPLQQGLLTHFAGNSSAGIDIVQIVFHLPEPLEAPAFARAWQWLARRHAILRTSFDTGTAERPPLQMVHEETPVHFIWHDWRGRDAAAQEEQWIRLLAADRARGLDPTALPLWRITVGQFGDRDHRVIFTFHHLLLDARALLVLLPELFAATEAYQAGHEPTAGQPRAYGDYIAWLQARDSAPSLRYWRDALAGFINPTPLPLAGSPASAPVAVTGSHHRVVRLDAAQTSLLKRFAHDHAVTLNTLVQGTWALLLGRCSGENEVVFGAVRACRHASVPGAEQLVGPLINTVPMRVALTSGVRVVDWLRTLRRQWVEMRPHEHVALSAILPWTDLPPGTALFDTVVSYQEPAWDEALAARGGPWACRRFDVHNQLNHPLALDAAGGDTLQLRLSFDPARFHPGTIDRMLRHCVTLLEGMVTYPDRFLANLPLLTREEESLLLKDWSTTKADFGEPVCVQEQFARIARIQPEALAVSDAHRSLTYAALEHEAARLAVLLQRRGAAPGVVVGVCLPSSVDLVVALLAVLKTGGAYLPMDPAYPAERLAFMVGDAGIRLLVTGRGQAALFSCTPVHPVLVDEHVDGETAAPPAPIPASIQDPAYLIYTSGSTGVPKGVSVRHGSLANLVAWHRQAYAVTPADRATQLASPAFDACVWELWPYLTAGASIHIPDADVRVTPGRLVAWLAAHRITLSFIPTPLAESLLDETWPKDTTLRAILTGGDRLRRWPGDRLPCPLFNHYGPTETTVVATVALVPPVSDGYAAPAIGRPIANTEAYVLDAHRQPVPIGVPGELYLGGAGLAEGYHGRSGLTAGKFVPHLFDHLDGQRLYRTGDLVRWREDRQLDYLGRLDQQVKIRGHRIEPAEIEAALNDHAAVRESLVLAREDATGQPQLVAYYVPRPGHSLSPPASLAAVLHRRLPAYMVPVAFRPLEAWPLTAHGKVDRNRLPSPDASPASESIAPRPGLESTIAGIWSEVLGCPRPGACDDFFALGGHSLRAAQVVARLNALLPVALTVRHLFEHSTIASLAALMEQRLRPAASPAPSAEAELAAPSLK